MQNSDLPMITNDLPMIIPELNSDLQKISIWDLPMIHLSASAPGALHHRRRCADAALHHRHGGLASAPRQQLKTWGLNLDLYVYIDWIWLDSIYIWVSIR